MTQLETLEACKLCGSKKLRTVDEECNICKCLACGYVFDNPRPTIAAIQEFYSREGKYDTWLAEERARNLLWQRRLKKMEATKKPGSLLDVGTGIGQFLHHAKAFYPEVAGTEISESAIEVARQKYNLDIFKGGIESIDFKGKVFDNITLFHVLEHVPNPKLTLEVCRNLLSPGGILVIAVPDDFSLGRLKAIIKIWLTKLGIRKYARFGKYNLPKIRLDGSLSDIHLSHFTLKVLKRCLESSGFKVINDSLDPYYAALGKSKLFHDFFYFWASALKHMLGINLYNTIWIAARKV